ncbi:hypothetical protein GW17_00005429 [Ensete ventricosum]|nr:hypothetical protein GW17_00005429 [Ensete ventricosum]
MRIKLSDLLHRSTKVGLLPQMKGRVRFLDLLASMRVGIKHPDLHTLVEVSSSPRMEEGVELPNLHTSIEPSSPLQTKARVGLPDFPASMKVMVELFDLLALSRGSV